MAGAKGALAATKRHILYARHVGDFSQCPTHPKENSTALKRASARACLFVCPALTQHNSTKTPTDNRLRHVALRMRARAYLGGETTTTTPSTGTTGTATARKAKRRRSQAVLCVCVCVLFCGFFFWFVVAGRVMETMKNYSLWMCCACTVAQKYCGKIEKRIKHLYEPEIEPEREREKETIKNPSYGLWSGIVMCQTYVYRLSLLFCVCYVYVFACIWCTKKEDENAKCSLNHCNNNNNNNEITTTTCMRGCPVGCNWRMI